MSENATRKTRVLVVEDEKSIRLTMAMFLEAAGHTVHTAASRTEATALVDEHDFDVAILDILLGQDNGVDIAKAIRDRNPNTQIIFATGAPEVRSSREAIHLHAFDYLTKPVGKEQLLEVVSRAAEEKQRRDAYDQAQEQQEHYQKELEGKVVERTAELAQREKQYRELVENLNDVIFELAIDSHFSYISPVVEVVLGYRPADLVGQAYEPLIHPDDLARIRQAFEHQLAGRIYPSEYRMRKQDGSYMWVKTSSRSVLTADGQPAGIRGVMTDISERKRAEDRLRFLGAIAEQVTDSIMVTDVNFKITYINSAGQALFGYANEELIGRTPDILNAEPTAEKMQKALYRTVSSGKSYTGEGLNKRKDGTTFICEYKVSPTRNERGEIDGSVAVQRDISERKQAETALVRANKRLQSLAGQLSDIDEAEHKRLSRELHDRVGQSLTALAITLSYVAEALPADTPPDILGKAKNACVQAEALAGDIRDVMTELRPLVLDDYGLIAAVRAYGEGFSQRNGISVVIDEVDEIRRLSSHTETAVFRIVQETLTNVLRHAEATETCITCEANSTGWRMVIADNGIGFEVAPDTESESHWGLTIMRERAHAMGCDLCVHSCPGNGTSVVIDIPASAGKGVKEEIGGD